jgi:hypothetical protein
MKTSGCMDCGKLCSLGAERCQRCAQQLATGILPPAPRTRMRISEWQTDEDGTRWRVIEAAPPQ